MITKQDLEMAIAECQGKRNPDAKTCIMLAAFYTIRKEMFGEERSEYSYAPAPIRNTLEIDSDSEFARAVSRMDTNDVLMVMDELMDTLHILQPRLYNAVMDRLT